MYKKGRGGMRGVENGECPGGGKGIRGVRAGRRERVGGGGRVQGGGRGEGRRWGVDGRGG